MLAPKWFGFFIMMLLSSWAQGAPPNIILILADDLGYGDIGSYGQKVIKTPELDRMAREGMRFTHFYAGATVCAPSRCVLLTGKHQGQARIRGNGPEAKVKLEAEDVTIAEVLKEQGYRTHLYGKWGLGEMDIAESGLPRRQGFDDFLGFLNHVHAHNHFPSFLWKNETKVTLPNVVPNEKKSGGGFATEKKVFADDLFCAEVMKVVSTPSTEPFFIFWSLATPHANNERTVALGDGTDAPDLKPYEQESWPEQDKGHAALITRIDRDVGRLLDYLRREKLAENTLVLFTSDNGPHQESGQNLKRFQPTAGLRGIKRSLHEGGIRVPLLAWWPSHIPANTVSPRVSYQGDFIATFAELTGGKIPLGCHSISMLPTLRQRGEAPPSHRLLYWEFHEKGFDQAALYDGRWKAIRREKISAPLELYDLQSDEREEKNVAAEQPELVKIIDEQMKATRTESALWPVKN
jgi:arylsulfatase A-like enzyme